MSIISAMKNAHEMKMTIGFDKTVLELMLEANIDNVECVIIPPPGDPGFEITNDDQWNCVILEIKRYMRIAYAYKKGYEYLNSRFFNSIPIYEGNFNDRLDPADKAIINALESTDFNINVDQYLNSIRTLFISERERINNLYRENDDQLFDQLCIEWEVFFEKCFQNLFINPESYIV